MWRIRGDGLSLASPVVMGILNLTPDSFSDGGLHRDPERALERAEAMVADGAGILDVGGESTRPGARAIPAEEELERVLPFLERAADRLDVAISIDTRKAGVARAALAAGARIVNDVSALSFDPGMAATVAEAGAGVVLMHMRGSPEDMAARARYASVADEVADELRSAVTRARAGGVSDEAIVVDPGLGFAKSAEHSLALLGDLGPIRALGYPVLVGPSRKSFLGKLLDAPPEGRLAGTLAACVAAYLEGARIFRVHDVRPVAQALTVAAALAATRRREGEEALP